MGCNTAQKYGAFYPCLINLTIPYMANLSSYCTSIIKVQYGEVERYLVHQQYAESGEWISASSLAGAPCAQIRTCEAYMHGQPGPREGIASARPAAAAAAQQQQSREQEEQLREQRKRKEPDLAGGLSSA